MHVCSAHRDIEEKYSGGGGVSCIVHAVQHVHRSECMDTHAQLDGRVIDMYVQASCTAGTYICYAHKPPWEWSSLLGASPSATLTLANSCRSHTLYCMCTSHIDLRLSV